MTLAWWMSSSVFWPYSVYRQVRSGTGHALEMNKAHTCVRLPYVVSRYSFYTNIFCTVWIQKRCQWEGNCNSSTDVSKYLKSCETWITLCDRNTIYKRSPRRLGLLFNAFDLHRARIRIHRSINSENRMERPSCHNNAHHPSLQQHN